MVGGNVRVAGSGAGISVVSSRVVAVVGGIPSAVRSIAAGFVASKCSGSRVVRWRM